MHKIYEIGKDKDTGRDKEIGDVVFSPPLDEFSMRHTLAER